MSLCIEVNRLIFFLFVILFRLLWESLEEFKIKYIFAPISHVAPSKPPCVPTVEEEAVPREYGCLIKEEDHVTEEDEGTPWLLGSKVHLWFLSSQDILQLFFFYMCHWIFCISRLFDSLKGLVSSHEAAPNMVCFEHFQGRDWLSNAFHPCP